MLTNRKNYLGARPLTESKGLMGGKESSVNSLFQAWKRQCALTATGEKGSVRWLLAL